MLSFWSVIQHRKGANLAEPVPDLVERLTKRKDSTNKVFFQSAPYAAGMIDYCRILCDLYPWTATPLIFTSKDAFELGVAQLEASLWSNMSVTALHLAKSTGDNGWLHIAQAVAAAVYNMRFATPKLLARAYWHSSNARLQLMSKEGNMLPTKQVFESQGSKESLLSMLIHCAEPNKWAHEKCYDTHTCWSYKFFTPHSEL